MKVLIAYDGSESADTAIDGLRRAGLPIEADALVISVAEVWLPPPEHEASFEDSFPSEIPGLDRARARAAERMSLANETAQSACGRISQIFPQWQLRHQALSGSPAHEILNLARQWEPDLIVVGSHGRTALGRFVLGSVSQKILTEAQTSVRIARETIGTGVSAVRLVVGVDGSDGAKNALRVVALRGWPPGSEVRVVVAEDPLVTNSAYRLIPPVDRFIAEVNDAEHGMAEKLAADAVNELSATLKGKSVTVSSVVVTGVPKQALVAHAEEFGADCIFTGATGLSNPIERFLVGSVSAAVAARAACSVEVVRLRNGSL
jgi:nucleotide-binding universal stress UspA family protein